MKNIRLTPLNMVSALLFFAVAYLVAFADETGWRRLGSVPLMVLLLLCLFSDIFFRFFLKDLKRIWIVETLFLIFVLLMIYILQDILT